jgi:lysophospholipase L1-like esterase
VPSLRRAPRLRALAVRLLAVVLSSLFALLVIEVGFRIAGYEPIYAVYSKPELFWQRDPLLGWSLEPGAEGEYVGPRPFPIAFRAPVRINSLGFRGEEPRDLPANGQRVLLLGDSQAAAFEVAEERTYAELVEAQLGEQMDGPVEVVNAGVRGYGTDQSYLLYRERARDLDPDVVVFHASANDPEDDTTLHRMRRPFGKPALVPQPDGSFDVVGAPVPAYPFCSLVRLDESFAVRRLEGARARGLCWVQSRLADHSALLSFVSVRLQRNPRLLFLLNRAATAEGQAAYVPPASDASAPQPPPQAPASPPPAPPPPPAAPAPPPPSAPLDHAHQLTSDLVRRLASEVHADGARFVLLANAVDLAALDRAAFERDGIEIVVADDALGADQTAFRFPNDGHLNVEGHQRLADMLAPRLAEVLRR